VIPTLDTPHSYIARNTLAVVLISPDEQRRRALAAAFERQQATITGELGGYPSYNNLAKVTETGCDVVVVDLDGDPDVALDLVETVCGNTAVTVMAYSQRRDPDVLVRCMHAGAREFLTEPLTDAVLAEAVIRASARRLEVAGRKRVDGRMLVFWGAKGGVGVSTVAANFAIALRRNSGSEIVLVDLHPDLGDLAVSLGLSPKFTVSDALLNSDRLDQDFVATLLTDHTSGVRVLAAPDEYRVDSAVTEGGLGRLLHVLRGAYPYVVIDAGPSLGPAADLLFQSADVIYLVAQADIAALHNAQRMILRMRDAHRLDLVLNRSDSRRIEIDDDQVEKALGVPVKWRVPNDFQSAHRSHNTATPLALGNSPISRALDKMAREACGKPARPAGKKWMGLFD